jgi:hypothetical protein
VKVPAEVIQRFHDEIDWAAADHRERARGLVHQMLIDYLNSYLRGADVWTAPAVGRTLGGSIEIPVPTKKRSVASSVSEVMPVDHA